jgi:hypothetical protein
MGLILLIAAAIALAIAYGGEHRSAVLCFPYDPPEWLRFTLIILVAAAAFLIGLYLAVLGLAFCLTDASQSGLNLRQNQFIGPFTTTCIFTFAAVVSAIAVRAQTRLLAIKSTSTSYMVFVCLLVFHAVLILCTIASWFIRR